MLAVGAAAAVTFSPSKAQERTFGGYECTEDCSGHKAGYEWAEEHNITDESDCGGNSQSFIEGCQTYTRPQAEVHPRMTRGTPGRRYAARGTGCRARRWPQSLRW